MRFLAVLELYKEGLIDLAQPATFADLQVTWLGRSGDESGQIIDLVEEYQG